MQSRKNFKEEYFSDDESWDLKDFEDITSNTEIFNYNNIEEDTHKIKLPCCFKIDNGIEEIFFLEQDQEIQIFFNIEEVCMESEKNELTI